MDSGSTKILLNNNHQPHNIVGMKRKSMTSINNNSNILSTNNMIYMNGNGLSNSHQYQYQHHQQPQLQQPQQPQQQQQQQSQYQQYSNGNSWNMSLNNNYNNGSIQNGNIASVGVVIQACSKCGGKKRHSKTCIFRRDDEGDAIVPSKDVIQRLDVAALKRYKKHYRLKTKHNSSKAELASIVRSHFDGLPVNEGEIIENFMFKVKNVPTLN